MDYTIREMAEEEYSLLEDFLYAVMSAVPIPIIATA